MTQGQFKVGEKKLPGFINIPLQSVAVITAGNGIDDSKPSIRAKALAEEHRIHFFSYNYG